KAEQHQAEEAARRQRGAAVRARYRQREGWREATVTEECIADALSRLPRWFDGDDGYRIWLKAVMAVYSVFPDERGIALLEAWSPGYEGEIERKFRSFTAGTTVKIGSLWWLARQYDPSFLPPAPEQDREVAKRAY